MAREIEVVINRLTSGIEDAEIAALQRLEGEMKRRIFNNGKATNGTPLDTYALRRLGRYSYQYGKKRQRAGRRTDVKDLEFYGDLRRSIAVGKSGRSTVLGFTYDEARLIAEGQEIQTRKTIFKASDNELDTAIEIYLKRVRRGR